MDNDIKLSKYWDGARLRNTISLMEQFWVLMNDETLDEKHRICAKQLFEHERRLAMNLLMKEFPSDFKTDMFMTASAMENMFKKYEE